MQQYLVECLIRLMNEGHAAQSHVMIGKVVGGLGVWGFRLDHDLIISSSYLGSDFYQHLDNITLILVLSLDFISDSDPDCSNSNRTYLSVVVSVPVLVVQYILGITY